MKILFIIFLLISVNYNAQNSYYIRPSILTKYTLGSTKANSFSDFDYNPSNEITFYNKFFTSRYNVRMALYGINLGKNLINHKSKIEFGFNLDQSVAGFYYRVENVDLFAEGQTADLYLFERKLYNFSFNYIKQLNNVEKKINTNFKCGVSYVIASQKTDYEMFRINSGNYEKKEVLVQSISSYTNNNYSLFMNLGFQLEVKSSNKKHLFYLATFYSYSFNVLNQIETSVIITHKLNSEKEYLNYKHFSKGSGLYFELSRIINFKINSVK
jgi:hypothetical protein